MAFNIIVNVNDTLASFFANWAYKNGYTTYDHKSVVVTRKLARHIAKFANNELSAADFAERLTKWLSKPAAPKIIERKGSKDNATFSHEFLDLATAIVKDVREMDYTADLNTVANRLLVAADYLWIANLLRADQRCAARNYLSELSEDVQASVSEGVKTHIAAKTTPKAKKVVMTGDDLGIVEPVEAVKPEGGDEGVTNEGDGGSAVVLPMPVSAPEMAVAA